MKYKCASKYRPVSLTSVLCKYKESLMREHMRHYFKKISASGTNNMVSYHEEINLHSGYQMS